MQLLDSVIGGRWFSLPERIFECKKGKKKEDCRIVINERAEKLAQETKKQLCLGKDRYY
jgi:hypothetical protein